MTDFANETRDELAGLLDGVSTMLERRQNNEPVVSGEAFCRALMVTLDRARRQDVMWRLRQEVFRMRGQVQVDQVHLFEIASAAKEILEQLPDVLDESGGPLDSIREAAILVFSRAHLLLPADNSRPKADRVVVDFDQEDGARART